MTPLYVRDSAAALAPVHELVLSMLYSYSFPFKGFMVGVEYASGVMPIAMSAYIVVANRVHCGRFGLLVECWQFT